MKIIDCGGQRTETWFEWHIGRLTSSRIGDVIAKRKRKPSEELQCRIDMRMELAVERITKKPAEHFVSKWMERGIELEPLARAAYELRTDAAISLADFVEHPTIEQAGCSPDGLDGADGLIEIKVPTPRTHAQYMLGERVPEEYEPQMLWQLACCPERKWNTFVSYCPDFPEPLDLFVRRLPRDDQRIAAMEAEAVKFLEEVGATVVRLTGGLAAALRHSLAAMETQY